MVQSSLPLIDPDDVVRHRALAEHQEFLRAAAAALKQQNRIWAETQSWSPDEPHRTAAMDQARAAFRWNLEQTIFGKMLAAGPGSVAHAIVFLRWENEYPQEWRAPDSYLWSPWGYKESVLQRLDRDGMPAEFRQPVADLVIVAAGRAYRCKDWRYARLVRHLSGTDLLDRLTSLRASGDDLVRLRAEFLTDVSKHPGRALNRTTWRRWLAQG